MYNIYGQSGGSQNLIATQSQSDRNDDSLNVNT